MFNVKKRIGANLTVSTISWQRMIEHCCKKDCFLFFLNLQSVTKYHSPSPLEIPWLFGSPAVYYIPMESTTHGHFFAFLVLFVAVSLPHELYDTFYLKKSSCLWSLCIRLSGPWLAFQLFISLSSRKADTIGRVIVLFY